MPAPGLLRRTGRGQPDGRHHDARPAGGPVAGGCGGGLPRDRGQPLSSACAGRTSPTLKSLDTRDSVIQVGSFAKSAFPGARVGFAVADQRVADADGGTHLLAEDLARVKSMVTVNTPSISQALIGGLLAETGDRMAEVTRPAAEHYGKAMRHLQDALERSFPRSWREGAGVSWNRPDGGFFLTLRLPVPADDALLVRSAESYGVLWTPMSYFQVGEPDAETTHSARLSCSYLSMEQIDEGVARLASLVGDLVAESAGGGDDGR
ncbi:aminotransferase class I/II-fold pyridoxal phosphate-dependent enzyme [Nocardiopsis sp. ARC36]